jgi:hypothetical protein
MNDKKTINKDELDLLALGFDILIPFVLDKLLFNNTKGRLIKLVGTVAAQQALKLFIQSNAFDIVLDTVEDWVKVKKPSRIVETYPSANDAMKITNNKKWIRSRPEDYQDPEREMYI